MISSIVPTVRLSLLDKKVVFNPEHIMELFKLRCLANEV